MTLVQKFTEKYGINPIKLVEDANLEFFGIIKSNGLIRLLEDYIEKKDLKIELTDEFFKDLVESFAEAGEKFPEKQKAPELVGVSFEIPNLKASIPKSKGTLENFKDIVGNDGLRPVMMGVYVSEDGFLVGTDAHKLVKLKTNEFSENKGKIIDLPKYIKSKGKLIDFIDGKYPNYEAVIPKENLEEKALSTYAFYNLAKSAQEVKRLTSNTIFNINLKLKTGDTTEVFAFSYIIFLEALTFAITNGWEMFTLEYSLPSRAVVLNFGDGNLALVMPVFLKDAPLGAEPMTPEEIEEKYRLGLTSQKKPATTTKKPTVSTPASSEPFKKFEGELSDTTYVHRSQIESINLVNGEVLGKNDVIDGFYRVNKKMAHGGGIDQDEPYSKYMYSDQDWERITKFLEKTYTPSQTDIILRSKFMRWVSEKKNFKNFVSYFNESKKQIDKMLEEEGEYAHGGSMYAGGGSLGESGTKTYKLRAEGLNDFMAFLQNDMYFKVKSFTVEITGFPDVVVTFETASSLSEIKEKLKGVPDSHVMLETVKPIKEYTGERGKMAHGGSTNSYSNKNSEEVWNSWNINQREHFLSDHMITTSKTMDKRISLYRFDELPIDLVNVIEYRLKEHIIRGSYADGGSMYAGGGKIDPIDMAEVESSAIFYTEKGKWSPEPTVEKFENQIREYQEMKRALDNNEIRPSKIIGTGLKPQYVRPLAYRWLEERTLIAKRAIEILKERMGGSTPSSHEIGETVTFNSVLGGTKTGTIISKIGDEGFRIKTGDGFATVKKSAIV